MRLDNPGVKLSTVQLSKTPEEPHRKPQATLIDDQREARKPPTILYKVMPEYTEIARINRIEGSVVIGAYFTAEGFIAGIRAARGLPDGLTWRAILATRMVRFTPASRNSTPVRTREFIEFNFNPRVGSGGGGKGEGG